jgi:RNA polymerase sigma factor (sigma-70 family)
MPETESDTVELLRRWHAGERAALEALLARHIGPLHQFVRTQLAGDLRRLRNEADSMDMVQAAAVRVLEYTPAFIPENGRQFHRLLRKIVVNDLRNRLRAPRVVRREPGPDPGRDPFGDSVLDLRSTAPSSWLPDRAADAAERRIETRAWARLALEFLPDELDRRLVLLAAVEEWSWKEIGAELGWSQDAARMRFQRLLPKLANQIRVLSEGRIDELLGDEGT